MRKTLLLAAVAVTTGYFAEAQIAGKQASLNADGQIEVRNITIPADMINNNRDMNIIEGFPFGIAASPFQKNSRGATLADINNDGVMEILFGADHTLYALNGDGSILWETDLSGIITLPPSVADMDDDGNVEIVVNTVGLSAWQTVGAVHLLDANGEAAAGWPVSFDSHWMINAPTLADVDGDGTMEIITSERVSGTLGYLHVLNLAGESLNDGWPVAFTATPAFTPSVGDINNDGIVEIVTSTSADGALRVYDADGNSLEGFPQMAQNTASFSYQSPLLVDLTGNGQYEIVGSRHGDNPEYYAIDSNGDYVDGWPVASPGWTYAPPSAYDADGEGSYHIFMGNPNNGETPLDVIFGFAADGSDLPEFPINKMGGNEGVITIADINNDGVAELIFTSNITADGDGFIHAYSTDGSGELEGFPLRPTGFTFLNSAVIGDIDNDGNFDLTALSYTQTFGQGVDSLFVTAFNLDMPYIAENIYFNGYKGDNTRTGFIESDFVSATATANVRPLSVYPNPATNLLQIELPETSAAQMQVRIFDLAGKKVLESNINSASGEVFGLNISKLQTGIYVVQIDTDGIQYVNKLVKD